MKKFLNNTICDAAHPAGTKAEYFFDTDVQGLFLQRTASKKMWGFKFKPVGEAARVQMKMLTAEGAECTYPAMPIKAARARAGALRELLLAGKDPRVAQVVKPVVDTRMTIAQLVDLRIANEIRRDAENFKWSCMEIERSYDVDVIPLVGDVAVADFRISHLKKVTKAVTDRGCNTQANRVHQHVVALLDFACRETDEIASQINPLGAAKPPSREKAKTRALTPEEMRRLWLGAPGAMAWSDHVPTILRLMLATGQRPGEECAAIERGDVDLKNRLWTIPTHKTKNKAGPHHVPLNNLALKILGDRMRDTNGNWLFPNRAGDGPIPNFTVSKCVSQALTPSAGLPLGRLGLAKFTPQDLRRTVASGMAEYVKTDKGDAVPLVYISYVLNHQSAIKGNVTASVYVQYPYLAEKRELLEKWGAWLEGVISEEQNLQLAA